MQCSKKLQRVQSCNTDWRKAALSADVLCRYELEDNEEVCQAMEETAENFLSGNASEEEEGSSMPAS